MELIWEERRLCLDKAWLDDIPGHIKSVLRDGTISQSLDALAQLALHPGWTLRIFARFRPLQIDLCNRWFDQDDEQVDFQAFCAIARVLSIHPYLAPYAIELASKRRKGFFKNVGKSHDTQYLFSQDATSLGPFLLSLYRCLVFDEKAFSFLFHGPQVQTLLHHDQSFIRYLSAKILCLFLHGADAAFHGILKRYRVAGRADGPWDHQNIDYRFLDLWERRRHGIYDDLSKGTHDAALPLHHSVRKILSSDLSRRTLSISGVLQPVFSDHNDTDLTENTGTTKQNLRSLGEALLSSRPILISGLPGSGKSSLVRQAARSYGMHRSILMLHLNEQTDAKLLIGMYTSAGSPGSFKWQPGVLTTAVREGRWAVIEDLDRAPPEVISTILPLIERRQLYVPNLGGFITADPKFKLFATIRSTFRRGGEEFMPGVQMLGLRHWQQVHLKPFNITDLRTILVTTYPILLSHVDQILEVYIALSEPNLKFTDQVVKLATPSRLPGPHDLFKCARRVTKLLIDNGQKSGSEAVSEALQEAYFLELFDCLGGFSSSSSFRDHVAAVIARTLQMTPQRRNHCLYTRVPSWSASDDELQIGRARLRRQQGQRSGKRASENISRSFAFTHDVLRRMESIASAVRDREPCLLVGETGTGKTTAIQKLAALTGQKLVVVNLSQQSEAGDLLGGYKPLSLRTFALPLKDEFDEIFTESVGGASNKPFLGAVTKAFLKSNWPRLLSLWSEALKTVGPSFGLNRDPLEGKPAKRRKLDSEKYDRLRPRWQRFSQNLNVFEMYVKSGSKGFAFHFVEGNIVKAVREGAWVLLDEINLASPDTIESLADLLTNDPEEKPSLILAETGEVERVIAHPDFRIFAAMNPATDVGKRDLPQSLRSRFTEFYVTSPDSDRNSLIQIVESCLGDYIKADPTIAGNISDLYIDIIRLEHDNKLVDGANQRPHYSLRTLTRTLFYVLEIAQLYGLRRSIYEGFCMSFLTLLNKDSANTVITLIEKHILARLPNRNAMMKQLPRKPEDGKEYVAFAHYWMRRGLVAPARDPRYIITPFIKSNLLNLVRAASSRKFPVLLQGPTSSGKTSMVEYLAKVSGNVFVRINNHEHTDLQEYLGTYASDSEGRLRFQEGALVQAMRQGHWIVLDELNLAPTDILEALNRLLDDNRELFIPETQEVVRPHENFMLFATQNPAGLYGGRKTFSRAFRNRFLELHFDDIPEDELQEILEKRTQIAPSYCEAIIKVYKRLGVLRQSSRLFEQKNSFATLRDLFRWALRDADDRRQLAVHGYMLLAERVRADEEKKAVQHAIEEVFKMKIHPNRLYGPDVVPNLESGGLADNIVWTESTRRIFVLVSEAIKRNEPVLLIGGTGCGKTTVCQVIAEIAGKTLSILNAHQNTETGDLIGAQRPIRNRTSIESRLLSDLKLFASQCKLDIPLGYTLADLIHAFNSASEQQRKALPPELELSIEQGIGKSRALFEWADGGLVQAMKQGQHFLLDEISLADDSVLERLNSVLESGRTLMLAEKGTGNLTVTASTGFQFLATMNPGGDFGKRELSPALRNRFTEIWVPPMSSTAEIAEIAKARIQPRMVQYAEQIVQFASWFGSSFRQEKPSLSIREILGWIQFINSMPGLDDSVALLEGAALVYIDGLGANPTSSVHLNSRGLSEARSACLSKLEDLLEKDMNQSYHEEPHISVTNERLSVGRYSIMRATNAGASQFFSTQASTTRRNMARVLRSLQLEKPIMLEGNPGVGKTTLVTALADAAGIPLTRINLSEQTDLMDLFGSDVPVEGGQAGHFAWRDGPFLQAMQKGEWVLLDEMNLASQSVLEGLNACLDHRGEVYIPEIDQTFNRHPSFVLFAAQNPYSQGGGRKGLPGSFVNRFTVVYADAFDADDLSKICKDQFANTPPSVIDAMISYVTQLSELSQGSAHISAAGGPWEFNLRDILRWLQLSNSHSTSTSLIPFEYYEQMLFLRRLRSFESRLIVQNNIELDRSTYPELRYIYRNLSQTTYQTGTVILDRNNLVQRVRSAYHSFDLKALEILMTAVSFAWPVLLVGPSGCGKTSLIRHVAAFVGADLIELPLSSDMDTMDIIGGYEQVDYDRLIKEFVSSVKTNIAAEVLTTRLDMTREPAWILLESSEIMPNDLQDIADLLREISTTSGNDTWKQLLSQCQSLQQRLAQDQRAQFEWTDGILVRALEEGKWIVLDHANLCSSSVLDRLNSLLEPSGLLSINEQRTPDGSAKIVRPHAGFRLFLTMDPRHGELSRAMRNRCVELFMPEFETRDSPKSDIHVHDSYDSSLFRLQCMVGSTWTKVDHSLLSPLLSISFDRLSFSDEELLGSLGDQLSGGLQSLQFADREAARRVWEWQTAVDRKKSQIRENVELMYRNSAALVSNDVDDLVLSESIYPLNNSLFLALNKSVPNSQRPHIIAKMHDMLIHTSHIRYLLRKKENGLLRSQAKAVSRLDRSILARRVLSYSKDSTQPIFPFLSEVVNGIVEWLNKQSSSSIMQTTLSSCQNIIAYVEDMFDMTDLPEFDESAFQTMLAIGHRVGYSGERTSTDIEELALVLTNGLSKFNQKWRLTTGSSMSLFWKLLRPIIAMTEGQRDLLGSIKSIASELDRDIWSTRASIKIRCYVRDAMVSTYDTVLKATELPPNSKELIQNLITAVEDLKRERTTTTYPLLEGSFQGIMQLRTLLKLPQDGDAARHVELLSRRRSQHSIHPLMNDGFLASLASLGSITGLGLDKLPLISLKQNLMPMTLSSLERANSVAISAFPLLLEEMQSLPIALIPTISAANSHPLVILNRELAKLHKIMFALHAQYLEDRVRQDLLARLGRLTEQDKASEAISCSSDTEDVPLTGSSQIRWVFEELFEKSLSATEVLYGLSVPDIKLSAKAWIYFSTAMSLLYIPDKPFDPALQSILVTQINVKRRKKAELQLQAQIAADGLDGQLQTSPRMEESKKELEELQKNLPTSSVFRPKISHVDELQTEFATIISSVLLKCQKLDFSQSSALQLLSTNTEKAIDRLSKRETYEDLTMPAICLLRGLLLGLKLSLINSDDSKLNEDTMLKFASLTSLFGFNRRKIASERLHRLKSSIGKIVDYRLIYLQSASLDSSMIGSLDPSMFMLSQQIFDDYYLSWKRGLEKGQKEYAAQNSLYRYQGQSETEEIDEKELRALFPTSESTDSQQASEDKRLESSVDEIAQKHVAELATVHHSLFQVEDSNRGSPLRTLFTSVVGKTAQLLGSIDHDTMFNMSACKLLPVAVTSIKLRREALTESTTPNQLNFYHDSNVREMKKVLDLALRIEHRFNQIHEAWPEQASPLDVLRTVAELLQFKHTEPVAKFLTKAEQLHTFVYQWQQLASREFSAANLYNELTDLLVHWRRLELTTWASLLDTEDESCANDAKNWWFIAYETIIAASLTAQDSSVKFETHVEQLVQTLSDFLRTTSVGQFSYRMQMIDDFRLHVRELSRNLASLVYLEDALENLLYYYRRFENSIKEHVKQKRASLEKKLKETIILTSWKDTNIEALRSSAKASHAKLFRIVRKYREILSEPAGPVIGKDLNIDEKASLTDDGIEESQSVQEMQVVSYYPVPSENSKPCAERFSNPQKTLQIMQEIAQLPVSLTDCAGRLHDWIEDVKSQSKELQQETPSSLTDDNKELVQSLKSRKRRLFADVLKGIRQMGFKTNLDTKTKASQDTIAKVLSASRSPRKSEGELISGQDFYRFFDNLLKAQTMIADRSEDLANNEVERCIVYLQGFGEVLLAQRCLLSKSQQRLQETARKIESLKSISISTSLRPSAHKIARSDMTILSKWLPEVLQFVASLIQTQQQMGGVDVSEVKCHLDEQAAIFEDIGRSLKTDLTTPERVCLDTEQERSIIAKFTSAFAQLKERSKEWKAAFPSYTSSFEHLDPWFWPDDPSQEVSSREIDLGSLDDTVRRGIDDLLLDLQKVNIFTGNGQVAAERSWLFSTQGSFQSILESFQVDRMLSNLEDQIEHFCHAKDESDIQKAVAMTAYSYQFFSQYHLSYRHVVQQLTTLYACLVKTSRTLSDLFCQLLSRGFCSPQEGSGQGASSQDKLEEGTGLGEGEGAQDISKDIEEDEDLEDLTQGGQPEKNKEPLEDEENAVDMADQELEGQFDEDAQERDEDEQGQDKEEEDQEPEEQLDDVDQSDPEALDEKLWNGENEDDSGKDKKADKAAGQKKDDDAAQEDAAGDDKGETMEEDGASGEDGEDGGQPIEDSNLPQVDNNLQEEEKLDLPDDMELDKDQKSVGDAESDDGLDEMEGDVDDVASEDMKSEYGAENPEEGDIAEASLGNDIDELKDTEQAEEGDEEMEDSESANEDKALRDNMEQGEANDDQINGETDGLAGSGEQEEDDDQQQQTSNGGVQGQGGAKNQDEGPEDEAETENKEASAAEGGGSKGQDDAQEAFEPQSFKKLGDALEKFQRSFKEIQKASDKERDPPAKESADEMADEFEHLPNDETQAEAQALDTADDDQARGLEDGRMDLDQPEDDSKTKADLPTVSMMEDEDEEEGKTKKGEEDTEDAMKTDQANPSSIGRRREARKESPDDVDGQDMTDAESEGQMHDLDDGVSEIRLDERAEREELYSIDDAQRLWSQCEATTHELALSLTEQLRLILAPTLATKMRGDFRTGKRLNIKRIIPYIASQYKRDKIWMRRSVPSKRSYQIMLSMDDSKSMDDDGVTGSSSSSSSSSRRNGQSGKEVSNSVQLAFDTLALVSRSLSMLEVGQLCITSFGADVHIAHAFDQPFGPGSGANVLQQFSFKQTRTDVRRLLERSLDIFREARASQSQQGGGGADLWQLQLIISDGICEDHAEIRRLIRQATQERVMLVFVIVDALRGGQSIVDLPVASFAPDPVTGRSRVNMSKYLDGFPFEYYLIVGDVRELPAVLGTALRQWFAEVVES